MALLLTSVFGVTGCGSDDDGEAPVESRIKNSINCLHDSAKVRADDSYQSLDKSWCTRIEVSEEEDFMDDMEKFKDVDELMFKHKYGETIYDSPYDDINGG